MIVRVGSHIESRIVALGDIEVLVVLSLTLIRIIIQEGSHGSRAGVDTCIDLHLLTLELVAGG